MRLKSAICVLLIAFTLACGMSLISAYDAQVANHNFVVPDSFDLNETYGNSTSLDNSSGYTIFINVVDSSDLENAKENRESLGFEFTDEKDFTDNETGISINQQNYVLDNTVYEYYSFTLNDTSYSIALSYPDSNEPLDYENSPVKIIIDSLQ